MKEETKEIIESVIAKFKEKENGLVYNQEFVSLFENNPNLRLSVGRIIIDDLNLIERVGDFAYRLSMKGLEFESFDKLERLENAKAEKESLEIELAKSNIAANKLNKDIADQNNVNEKHNRIAPYINILIGIVNIGLLLWQILKNKS